MSWPHAEQPPGTASMIQDGSTLQMGIDGIPDAAVNVVIGLLLHTPASFSGRCYRAWLKPPRAIGVRCMPCLTTTPIPSVRSQNPQIIDFVVTPGSTRYT